MFITMKTTDANAQSHKTLLYGHHGFGKTYQFRFYREKYGRGLIISGESGLASIADVDIDFLPFTSWDGPHDPANGVYSFVGITKMIRTDEFKNAGFQWIGIDSLTEMSERCLAHFQKLHEDQATGGKKVDGFAIWNDYERAMLAYLKWIRDLPMHVLVTALALEEDDDNGVTHYWPMVKMKKVAKHVPSLFDHVFCGIRKTTEDETGLNPRIHRFLITEEVKGWHGKSRDPHHRLRPIEKGANVVALHERMAMDEDAYQAWLASQRPATPASDPEVVAQ